MPTKTPTGFYIRAAAIFYNRSVPLGHSIDFRKRDR
jgi:hypothetical protein